MGIDVVRASRICAVAHGGQILVSQLTRDLLADAGVETIDLGKAPAEGHPRARAALPTRGRRLAGVVSASSDARWRDAAGTPPQAGRPTGRSRRDPSAPRALGRPARDDHGSRWRRQEPARPRSGGLSSSRAAGPSRRPRPGVGPDARSRGDRAAVGAREQAGRTLAEGIADALRGTHTLLFLDNLEHLTASRARHRDAARSGSGSRRPHDEPRAAPALGRARPSARRRSRWTTPRRCSSSSPPPAASSLQEDAMPSVREICRRLDGLPLAIELVAARLVVLPPARVLQALDEGLALEMEGPVDLPGAPTHAASHDRLELRAPERRASRQLHGALGVFAGGCTLDDARAVADAGTGFFKRPRVARRVEPRAKRGRGRRRPTVDARDRSRGRGRTTSRRTATSTSFAVVMRSASSSWRLQAEGELAGPEPGGVARTARVRARQHSRRARLVCSRRAESRRRCVRVSALGRFWRAHGHVTEARRWLVARPRASSTGVSRRGARGSACTAAHQATAQSDWDAAVPLLEEAIELFRECGREPTKSWRSRASGSLASARDDPRSAAAALSERALTLARQVGDARGDIVRALIVARRRVLGAGRARQGASALRGGGRAPTGRSVTPCSSRTRSTTSAWRRSRAGTSIGRAEAFEDALGSARELGDVLHTCGSAVHARGARPSRWQSERSPQSEHERASPSTRVSRTIGLVARVPRAFWPAPPPPRAPSRGAARRCSDAAEALRRDDAPDGFEAPPSSRRISRCSPLSQGPSRR